MCVSEALIGSSGYFVVYRVIRSPVVTCEELITSGTFSILLIGVSFDSSVSVSYTVSYSVSELEV
jgi:hypothetical protein